ncbi:MAG: periplasmic heavy metal sensor [Ignavibacteriales bacterium]|nr:periplasmic heavy metal sensor [Ignavibacteriales bacterium]
MDYLMKTRILIGVIIVLIIINITVIAFVFFSPHIEKEPQMLEGRGPSAALFLEKELGFSEEQKNEFAKLRRDHLRKTQIIRQELKKMKDSFFELIKEDTMNRTKLREYLAAIGQKESDINLVTFEHFKNVRAICNSEQRQKFDAIIQEVLRMLPHPAPPPQDVGGPRPGPPRGGE